MIANEIIEKINKASKFENVFSIDDFNFRDVIKIIHPDVCKEKGAEEASLKLNLWKDFIDNGKEYKDDVGTFKTNGYWVDFKSDVKNLNWSVENYRLFQQLQEEKDRNFLKYLPKECKLLPDGTYRFIFDKRAIPLSGLDLDQKHVNWVLNRLLEYSAYLSQTNFSHAGLNPESVFIVPETHGIQICSFYHLTRIGAKIGTISGKYSSWYPTEMFNNKIATPSIDIELSKKIAVYLLGDKSGVGIKLKKTGHSEFINFLLTHHDDSYECMVKYKELLKNNFKSEFHKLDI